MDNKYIAFILSFMKEGHAASWRDRWLEEEDKANVKKDSTTLLNEIKDYFEDTNAEGNARSCHKT